jgi:hypothetical protein
MSEISNAREAVIDCAADGAWQSMARREAEAAAHQAA